MSVNGIRNNLACGLNNALQVLSPLTIIAKKAPLSTDSAEFGQQWIYNNQIWEYTAPQTWTQLATQSANAVSVSGSYNITNNARSGTLILTGNTLTSTSTASIVFTNSYISISNGVLYALNSTNTSGGNAVISVVGAIQGAGSMAFSIKNNGSGSLGATDKIIIPFTILG